MCKRLAAIMIAALMVLTFICPQPARASSEAERQARFAEKVKAGILKLGTGRDAQVKLKLRDKRSLAGFVSEIRDDEFLVTDSATATTTSVAYSNVTQIKGNNLSTGAKIAIGVAVAVGVIITLYLIRGAFCDGC